MLSVTKQVNEIYNEMREQHANFEKVIKEDVIGAVEELTKATELCKIASMQIELVFLTLNKALADEYKKSGCH